LIPSTPPWLFRIPDFDYTLYNVGTKSNTSPDLYLSLYMKLVSENYEGYDKIFTDGSKQGICVAAAVSHTAGTHCFSLCGLPTHYPAWSLLLRTGLSFFLIGDAFNA
jgi:hypothetical protein